MVKYNNRINKFVTLYDCLTIESISSIDDLYSPAMVFQDPVHQINNRKAFKQYFINLLEPLKSCVFEIHTDITEGDTSFVCWTMIFVHKSFNKGKEIKVSGCSHLQWQQDKIIFHRDYFDLGEMIYEKIPILGKVILWIKNKLA